MKLPQQYSIAIGDDGGAFLIPFRGRDLKVIASTGMDWDHVSVSLSNRCPNWEEMCFVKSLFFDDEECVMQLHPPKSSYVNCHPYCLHLWKPQKANILMPPTILVGYVGW